MHYKGDIIYIEQVLKGNTNAFSYIVDHHKDRAYNLAYRICGNNEDAEEIAQDAFMKAYRFLDSFKMKCSFSTWLYRIVFNTAISYIRRKNSEMMLLEDCPGEPVSFAEESHADLEAEKEYRNSLVNLALRRLDETDKAIISLYYYEELSTEKIADITGLTPSNVKIRLFRSRQKMLCTIEDAETKKKLYHEKFSWQ